MTRAVDEPRVAVPNQPAIDGFEAFPVFDLSSPDMTTQANQRLAALREKSAVCQVQPLVQQAVDDGHIGGARALWELRDAPEREAGGRMMVCVDRAADSVTLDI